jgi:nucleoside-diphosphate-sugar epimerase
MDREDTSDLMADIAKAERLLGWKPRVDLATGLEIFVDWLKKTEKMDK